MTAIPSASAADCPLVTFVVLSYNQEKFIRAAVESAFAQTYSPLEIVLSDDCSPDGTFAIIEEMVAAYRGPHTVRAVQPPRNLGLLQHVMKCGREAQGAIVVMAGGDDIAKPHRVARLVEAFTPQTGAAYSLSDLIDAEGTLIREGIERGSRPVTFDATIARAMCLAGTSRHVRVTQGSTAAYRSELFAAPINHDRKTYSEEMLLCFYSYLLGLEVALVPEILVEYREHPGALSNIPDADRATLARRPEAEARVARRMNMEMYLDFHHIACQADAAGRISRAAILRNYREEEVKFFWMDMSFIQKVSATVGGALEGNFRLSAWCLSRLLGIYEWVRPKQKIDR